MFLHTKTIYNIFEKKEEVSSLCHLLHSVTDILENKRCVLKVEISSFKISPSLSLYDFFFIKLYQF